MEAVDEIVLGTQYKFTDNFMAIAEYRINGANDLPKNIAVAKNTTTIAWH